jgi:predicted secreted hydrolase
MRQPLLILTALAAVTASMAGCQSAPGAATQGTSTSQTLQALGAPRLDREAVVRLSAEALAEAVREGEAKTVSAFVSYADGPDPDPSATREMAKRAIALTGPQAADSADLARIAAGKAHPQVVVQATGVNFPEDEGAHKGAITEWWYLNGHLQAKGGDRYGYEFTLFKVGPILHWAHVAVTDQAGQRFSYSRDWVPAKRVSTPSGRLAIRFGEHALAQAEDGSYKLEGNGGGRRFSLTLNSQKAPLLIGGDGKIEMPEGKDSWYYSHTRLAAVGTLDGQAVTGTSWMDHQWGPFWVTGFKDRWDWFALQFEDNTEYNLFGFRDEKGRGGARHVNQSTPSGRGVSGSRFTMERLDWWKSPLTNMFFTTKWRIALPDSNETVELEATNVNQEVARKTGFLKDPLPNYWEGSMKAVKIRADGTRVPGQAYCEHFGFASPKGPQ